MAEPSYLDKAQEALKAAKLLLEENCPNSSVNRAYYASFHAARAALVAAGVCSVDQRWSHEGLQAAFSQLIRRRKLYPSILKDHLSKLIVTREIADYTKRMISLRAAKESVRMAEEFVSQVERRVAK